jgi:hypothetical protein
MSDQRDIPAAPSAGAQDPALGEHREAGRRGTSTGPNSRPLDDTIAQTGPGLPDDTAEPVAFAPGEEEALEDAIRRMPGRTRS